MYSLRHTKVDTIPYKGNATGFPLILLGVFRNKSVGDVDDCSMVTIPWIFFLYFSTLYGWLFSWLVEWSSEMTKEGIVTHFST